eukprot:jgi/Undpi1/286/HiC_scaffold_1.g00282.m1
MAPFDANYATRDASAARNSIGRRQFHSTGANTSSTSGAAVPTASGGGGGSKMGVVRVGLGLLVMGDIARAYASPTSAAVVAYPSGRGDERSVPCRRGIVVSGSRRSGESGGDGVRLGRGGARLAGGFVAPGGSVSSEGRPRARRKRASAAASVPCSRPMVVLAQGQHQNNPGGHQAMSRRSAATISSTAGMMSTITEAGVCGGLPPSATPRAGTSGAIRVPAAAGAGAMAAGAAATAGVGASSNRRGGVSGSGGGGRRGGGGGRPTGAPLASTKSGKRLGVIRSAEEGGLAGRRAKVKAMYFRARELLHGSPPACEEAIDVLEQALKLDGRDGHSWLLLARTQERMGEIDAARAVFKRATNACPKNAHLWQAWGMIEDKFGDVATARELFENGLKADPGNPFVCHAWGLMEQRDGRIDSARDIFLVKFILIFLLKLMLNFVFSCSYDEEEDDGGDGRITGAKGGELASHDEARRLFELGITADPAHGPLYNAYGTMEAKRGNVEHARDVYKRGIAARCNGMASVWQGLGALEASVGNRDGAREIFLRGARESTDDVSFLYHSLGSLELTAMRLEDARTAFVEGIGRYPKNTQLLLGAALAETKMGNTDDGRDFFRRAVQADPSHAHAWQAWGVMEGRLGNYEVARSLWESGLKANPLHGPLWQAYAVMEESLGEPDRARKLFSAGLERCPEHVQLHQAWAVMEGKEGDLSLARKLVLDGLRADPYHGALWTVYAIIERQDGSDGKARKVLQLGIRACPDHGPLYRSWAQLEFQAGNTADSRRVFEKGIAACPTYSRLYYAYGDMEASMGNTEFLEKLTARGNAALLGAGCSPGELKDFNQQMEAFAVRGRVGAVIDLGPKEACTGLTFVCLSRAKRLADLMVESMSFDRIGKLGNSDTMMARLREEVRLVDLGQSTRGRYTGMGVFNAVAAN